MATKLTMTINDVLIEMRKAGIPCSERSVSNGIAMGAYPFGRVSNIGPTGRRTLEIFRVDFFAWLESKSQPTAVNTYTPPLKFVQSMYPAALGRLMGRK